MGLLARLAVGGRGRWVPSPGLFLSLMLTAFAAAAPLHAADAPLQPSSFLEKYPISPPDTSSPRATLDSFLLIMGEAERLWVGARRSMATHPGRAASADEMRAIALAGVLLRKAAETMDLSKVPGSSRELDSLEAVLRFKEILDRLNLPDLATLPGGPAGSFLDSEAQAGLATSWTLPYTDLTLARSEDGDKRGRYLLTAASVERLERDYETLIAAPGRPDTGVDLFEYYRRSPGGLMPPRWYALIEAGPSWLMEDFNGQPRWKWLVRAGMLALFVAIPVTFARWMRRRPTPASPVRRGLRRVYLPLLIAVCIYTFRHIMQEQINLTGPWTRWGTLITEAVIWSAGAWTAYHLINTLGAAVLNNPKFKGEALDASLLRTGFRVLALAVSVIILGWGATQIGIPVYGVVAGLGIGGLAIALAAQPTMENLIGGVILYADQVARVGDFCKLGDISGNIETIGIRSTRIRAMDRTLVTVANADLVKMRIVNFSRRDHSHLNTVIGLRYETTPAQLRHILTELRVMLLSHPKVMAEDLRVRFVAFGAYSLDIELYAFIDTTQRAEFLTIQEELFLKVIDIVEGAGSGFAFPSTTAYLGRDEGLNPERKAAIEAAAAEVEAARETPKGTPA